MADKIKGITIELKGDATGLQDAIDKATDGLSGMQKELRQVEKGLKLSPDSVLLLEQKQELLTQSIGKTSDKLDILKEAYRQAAAQVKSGTLGEDKLREVERALVETEAKMRVYKGELDKTSEKLRDLANSADNAGEKVQGLGDDFEGTAEKVGSFADVVKGDALMNIGDKLGAAGDKVKEFGQSLMDLNGEYDNATRKASAYFGETGEAAQQTAQTIENVYKSGLGDSMGAVSDAVITVKKNLEGLDQTSLENITSQAMILEDAYGIDMNETMRGVNSLMEQFGLTAQEAMDYVVAGMQNGLDKTNELGDNLSEYAGKFAQAGYSAEEYFQLLNNGLDGGAYNLDKVNDAINEVTTRLVDGTIADNIGLYSDKTQELFQRWQEGGATQKEVIDSIVEDIQGTTNQQDALNMAAQAFGTMAEDGSLKFISSLTSTGDAYDNVIGKSSELNEATTSDSQQMEAAWRQIQLAVLPLAQQLTDLALQIIPPLAQKISELVSFLAENPVITNIAIAIGAVLAVLSTLLPVIMTVMGVVTAFGTGVLLPAIGIIAGIAAAIAAIITIVTNWGAITEWFSGVWQAVCGAITAAWEGVKAFFEGIPAWWSGIWTQVKVFFSSTWEAIKAKAAEVFSNIVESVRTKFNEAKTAITEVWTNIKEWLSQTVESIKTKVVETFGNVVTGVQEKVEGIRTAVENGIQKAVNFITALPGKALQWGKDFIQGFIDGISSMIGGVVDAVSGIADRITSWLHFSRPDEGPLREYETWMPDFMKGLAKGIRDNTGLVEDAVSGLAMNMTVSPSAMLTSQRGNGNDAAVMNDLMSLLRVYLPEIASQKNILLDGDTLVGKTSAAMDRSLGQIQAMKARIG